MLHMALKQALSRRVIPLLPGSSNVHIVHEGADVLLALCIPTVAERPVHERLKDPWSLLRPEVED